MTLRIFFILLPLCLGYVCASTLEINADTVPLTIKPAVETEKKPHIESQPIPEKKEEEKPKALDFLGRVWFGDKLWPDS
ncbi:MAG: hypothetical protein WCG04_03540 [Alphaproteobacteria bacterium]